MGKRKTKHSDLAFNTLLKEVARYVKEYDYQVTHLSTSKGILSLEIDDGDHLLEIPYPHGVLYEEP